MKKLEMTTTAAILATMGAVHGADARMPLNFRTDNEERAFRNRCAKRKIRRKMAHNSRRRNW